MSHFAFVTQYGRASDTDGAPEVRYHDDSHRSFLYTSGSLPSVGLKLYEGWMDHWFLSLAATSS